MESDPSSPESHPGIHPSRVRISIAGLLTVMSCLLYLDRFAVGIASESIREDLGMTQTQMSWFLSAFFWSYALSQIPAGWLSDRFGPRRILTAYILCWSLFTALIGAAMQVWVILQLRLWFGASQAGAYPVCTGLIRNWFPINRRGAANSIVALGGRAGAVLAPILTAFLMVALSSEKPVEGITEQEIFDRRNLLISLQESADSTSQNSLLAGHLFRSCSMELQNQIKISAEAARKAIEQEKHSQKDQSGFTFDPTDWLPISRNSSPALSSQLPDGLIAALSDFVTSPEPLAKTLLTGITIPPVVQKILDQQDSQQPPTPEKRRVLKRLVLETAFPNAIKKLQGRAWRAVLMAYGIVGILIALVFAWVCRDRPEKHPWCNSAERALIQEGTPHLTSSVESERIPFPWKSAVTSLSLWGNSLTQFFTNIGWLFVVTWLPRYLGKVHGVPLEEQALMTAVPTLAGILGMFCGGWWTDFAARHMGLKWGRRIPVMSTRFLAACGYLICLALGLTCTPSPSARWFPWAIILGLSISTFCCDLGVPAIWAYAQDVGGKFTASIMGWSNMFGNFGAACAPLMYNAVLGESPSLAQWNMLFGVCAAMFGISGCTAMVLDATRPIVSRTPPRR